jgi:hypothetical protein
MVVMLTKPVILPLLILSAIYGLVIVGVALILRRMGVPGKTVVVLSFLIFGAVSGILTAWAWPAEASIYLNWPGTLLGDRIYLWSIRALGDAGSAQAHYTIPWPLRIPQVYVIAAVAWCGLAALPLQWAYNMKLGEA